MLIAAQVVYVVVNIRIAVVVLKLEVDKCLQICCYKLIDTNHYYHNKQ